MERFGRYILLERIAAGGMAEVFRAASIGTAGFSKPLAIKRILPHLAEQQSFITMMVDEAKIAATLNHPNILQVLDLGNHDGIYFLAMEFVAGQSLNNLVVAAVRAGIRLPPEFCCYAVAQALHGLGYAHQKTDSLGKPMGIIHRDVSPQNIMVAYDGSVKLADFGIAKAADRNTHTLTGSLKGKPGYMAPEQVNEKPIDQRVDLYAMGVVLHELLSMKRMRKGPTDVKVLMDVSTGIFPKFEEMGVEVPMLAANVVYRALAAEPDERWQTSIQFANALEDVARQMGWHWGPPQVSALMHQLFPKEIERETKAQAHFQGLMQEFAEATSSEIPGIISRARADLESSNPALPPLTPNSPSRNTKNPLQGGGTASRTGSRGNTSASPPTTQAPGEAPRSKAPLFAMIAAAVLLGLGGAGFFMFGGKGGAVRASATGKLVVETEPSGATVKIGGKAQPGVTPIVVNEIPEGPVEVEATLEGVGTDKDVVIIEPNGTHKVKLTLAPKVVEVPVSSDPAGATILLDGRDVGRTPGKVKLNAGSHPTLRLTLRGHVPVEQELFADRAPTSLNFVLAREEQPAQQQQEESGGPKRPPPRKERDKEPTREKEKDKREERRAAEEEEESGGGEDGKLTIQSRPWGRIIVDGKDTGRFTPVADLPLPPGKHTIKLVNDEEELSATFTVVVKPGTSQSITKELK
ncbi:MAG: serine/threonine-protein kinase [Myxococcota bacterium]